LRVCDAITLSRHRRVRRLAGERQRRGAAPFDLRECVTAHEPSSSCAQAKQTWYVPIFDREWAAQLAVMNAKANWNIPEAVSSILRSLPALATPVGIQPI
jgi:hypothetical protein